VISAPSFYAPAPIFSGPKSTATTCNPHRLGRTEIAISPSPADAPILPPTPPGHVCGFLSILLYVVTPAQRIGAASTKDRSLGHSWPHNPPPPMAVLSKGSVHRNSRSSFCRGPQRFPHPDKQNSQRPGMRYVATRFPTRSPSFKCGDTRAKCEPQSQPPFMPGCKWRDWLNGPITFSCVGDRYDTPRLRRSLPRLPLTGAWGTETSRTDKGARNFSHDRCFHHFWNAQWLDFRFFMFWPLFSPHYFRCSLRKVRKSLRIFFQKISKPKRDNR